MKKRRLMATVLTAATAVSMLSGCGSSSGGSSSTYRMLYSGEVNTLNYLTTDNAVDTEISANVEDSLVEYDQYGNIKPCLAESWSSNDDMTVWTFKIRQGVKWVDKDGKAVSDVTANDWVTSAQYVNDAAHESGTQYMYSTGAVVKGAQEYYDYTAYMIASENGTKTKDADGNDLTPVSEAKAEDIGVTATDDYTLVYTLEQPCSFFLSVLSYASYLPVNKDFLDQQGDNFAMDNDSLLYCGAYTLKTYSPQEKHVLKKNPLYWDKDNVKIDEIDSTYNAEASSVEASMYKSGQIDRASISADLLNSWLQDASTKDQVHGTRPNNSYSYFYAFNFDPEFDAQYEPDNWKIAVNNLNFRKAMMAALDRIKAITVSEPEEENAKAVLNNTVTPAAFTTAAGKDYTQYDALKDITAGDSFDADAAVKYRDAAKTELTAAGCTFPIKVLMPYNPSVTNWDKECQVVEQQMEGVLGTDFIDIIVEAGPDTGFLSAVRRSGKYAFMKCNWGADYADPQTWTEPFTADNNYNFWDKSTDENTQKLFTEWSGKVADASAIYNDDEKRFTDFSEAEALLISNAIIVPFSISDNGYEVSKINSLEGEYAPYGMALQRYKFQSLKDKSMSMDEFNKALQEWKDARTKSIAESSK
ncbi:MAG: peptide ABC transporter substrate-binding protein [Lachnospiraceae bacterium]|jgi:oligopeptide transport system substrate-binding protein|nr:peptide ABC transporter substrate-binding protein [Lachnospiraceae bacterium]